MKRRGFLKALTACIVAPSVLRESSKAPTEQATPTFDMEAYNKARDLALKRHAMELDRALTFGIKTKDVRTPHGILTTIDRPMFRGV